MLHVSPVTPAQSRPHHLAMNSPARPASLALVVPLVLDQYYSSGGKGIGQGSGQKAVSPATGVS